MSNLDQLASPTRPPVERKPVSDVDAILYNEAIDKDSDKFLPYVWQRLQEEGLIDLYFPGHSDGTGFGNFVKLFSGNAQVLLLVERKPDGTLDRMIGFASWNPLPFGAAKAGVAGFIFFREFWDSASSVKAATRAMRHWFDELGLDIVMGLVASENHMAQRFLQRMGWTKCGTMPHLGLYQGHSCDGTFWYATCEMFHMREQANGHA